MEKFLTIDLFGQSALIENNIGQQILYTIESVGETFFCYQHKRNSPKAKWKSKRIVDSSNLQMRFEFAETEAGFKIEKISDEHTNGFTNG